MSRPDYDVRSDYTGTGLVSAYTFDFKIEALTQLLVVEIDSTGAEIQRVRGDDTDFLDSVDFDSIYGGGTVNLKADLPSNYKLIILLANDAPTQPSRFRNQGDFTLERIEMALDFVLGAVQRLAYLGARAIKLNDQDDPDDFDPTFPPGMATAEALIPVTNDAGNGWAPLNLWVSRGDLLVAGASADAAAASAVAAASSAASSAASAVSSAASTAAAAISAGAVGVEGTKTLANNQAVAADVTGLLLDHTVAKFARIDYIIQIITTGAGAVELVESGVYLAAYKSTSGTWVLSALGSTDDTGVVLTITAAGQVQYTTPNSTGTPSVSKINWRASTLLG